MSSGPKSGKRRKPNKIGRNDPCFCGSGLKYKKCCLAKGIDPSEALEIPQEVIDKEQEAAQRRGEYLQSKGIYISLPNTVHFKGRTMLAVGHELMVEDNPHATFHQLLFRNLQQTLGEGWWSGQDSKADAEKHYIKVCFEKLNGSNTRTDLDIAQVDENTRSTLTTGDTQALLSLAFDVWLLAHKGYLRDDWLNRLRDRNQYQGARYEIGVASMFVRMGCELEFYDNDRVEEDGNPPKRAEFIAVHTETGNRIAVEAKSRHVHGVIHTPGTLNYRNALKGDITKLYKEALKKVTDGLPLLIFVDVNSPSETTQVAQETKWYQDIRRSFDSRPMPTATNPDKHAAVFVTNFSPHYQGDDVSARGQYLFMGSIHSEHPLADGHYGGFMQKLIRSVSNYGYVPPSMDNDKLGVYEQASGLNKASFSRKIRELTMPANNDPEFDRRKSESDGLLEMLIWDTTQKSGGGWDNKVAADNYAQFEWLFKQP